MDVRDAVEADANRMAQLTGSPTDVMRNLVHDRTVRIACESADGADRSADGDDPPTGESGEGDDGDAVEAPGDREGGEEPGDLPDAGEAPGEESEEPETLGFVSFDAQRKTVHVTQIDGTQAARERLLEEPIRFARQEGMSVELLVAEDDDEMQSIAADAGFTDHGAGPRFGSTSTVRYRMDP